jgi:hypothetical protein
MLLPDSVYARCFRKLRQLGAPLRGVLREISRAPCQSQEIPRGACQGCGSACAWGGRGARLCATRRYRTSIRCRSLSHSRWAMAALSCCSVMCSAPALGVLLLLCGDLRQSECQHSPMPRQIASDLPRPDRLHRHAQGLGASFLRPTQAFAPGFDLLGCIHGREYSIAEPMRNA